MCQNLRFMILAIVYWKNNFEKIFMLYIEIKIKKFIQFQTSVPFNNIKKSLLLNGTLSLLINFPIVGKFTNKTSIVAGAR